MQSLEILYTSFLEVMWLKIDTHTGHFENINYSVIFQDS